MMKTKEKTHWKDVTADMMSEEEPDGDESIWHCPSWRSPFSQPFCFTKLSTNIFLPITGIKYCYSQGIIYH